MFDAIDRYIIGIMLVPNYRYVLTKLLCYIGTESFTAVKFFKHYFVNSFGVLYE